MVCCFGACGTPIDPRGEQARRIAIKPQVLTAERSRGLVELVQRLTLLQLEPTAAVAPSADVVCWSRLGPSYDPDDLVVALEVDRSLFEFDLLARPMSDVGLYLAAARDLQPWQERVGLVEANDRFREDILLLLAREGPLPASEIPDTAMVPWRSSGWNNNRNVQMMLPTLMLRCEVAVSGRDGKERLWDLAERVYPDAEVPPVEEARRRRDERRLSSLDRLVFDRKRLADLFEYEWRLTTATWMLDVPRDAVHRARICLTPPNRPQQPAGSTQNLIESILRRILSWCPTTRQRSSGSAASR